MNILIITQEPFPKGAALVNILFSYAKGFIENGADVTVLCLHAALDSKSAKEYRETNGIYKGVKYIYAPLSPMRHSFKPIRIFQILYSKLMWPKIISKLHKSKRIDVFLLFLGNNSVIQKIRKIASKRNVKFIIYRSEYPFILKRNDEFSKWYVDNVFKLFDGLIVETDRLRRYFADKINKNAKQIIVPPTTIPNEFLIPLQGQKNIEYIFYGGSLALSKKDGVPILIEAFSKVVKIYENIKLIISGFGPEEDIRSHKELIHSFGIDDKVIFKLNMERSELITYMRNAKILTLAKETNEIQSGGVSSKVVEYLYTGVPIVMTDLGEITDHLEDNAVVFKSKPDCAESFSQKLIYVLGNYQEAIKIADNGKKFALDYFDYKRHTKRIIKFFEGI